MRQVILLSIALILSGCKSIETVSLVEVHPSSEIRVAFDSFINVHYGKNRSLPGWQTTQTAIETTLKLWYDHLQVRQTLVDGTPADLENFLLNLPKPDECDISVVYLGSIQGECGGWEFTNGEIINWRNLLAAAPLSKHPRRIVILDACHAAAVSGIPDWSERFARITLLASDETELTYQFSPSALAPIDLQKQCPLAWTWGQTHLPPGWNKQISFLGVIWSETTAITALPPTNIADWAKFFDVCCQNAANFRQSISRRWSSTMQVFPPSQSNAVLILSKK